VEALPVNGGAYNCLLNGTSKTVASVAGELTSLSSIATAVISAKVAVEYVHTVIHGIPVIPGTIVLLLAFALLVISGIKDSAKVALAIFGTHITTLVLFVFLGLIYYLNNGAPEFSFNMFQTEEIIRNRGSILAALFFGFSASLLGVSGFESSANFVEEQKKGVFRKTLRNMLLGVTVFNPLIALIVLGVMTLPAIGEAKDFLLADAAQIIGGTWFQYLVVADAFMVLSGAVLTSYVGVSGLMSRMAADGCLPYPLTKMNAKGSYVRIIIAFFILCSSILIMTGGDLLSLAGVYTISFLGVMSLFALGNLILKQTRPELKRTYHAPVIAVILAFLATASGIVGNILIDEQNLVFFLIYFIPTIMLVMAIIYQIHIVNWAVRASRPFPALNNFLQKRIKHVTDGTFLVFIHNIHRLHAILYYIDHNEIGRHVILIHCEDLEDKKKNMADYEELKQILPMMKKAGVFPEMNIELAYEKQAFGPSMIDKMSKKYDIPKNRVLIGSIHEHHSFEYEELGGVRIIF